MRRKGLLLVSGCGEKRFENLAARNQLPFPSPEGKWNDYTLQQAYDLQLMLTGMDTWGASIELAQYVLNGLRKMPAHPLNHPLGEPDVWVGAAVVDDPVLKDDGSIDFYPQFTFAGRLEEVSAAVSPERSGWQARLRSIVLLNATHSARVVRERAREIGLPEGDDFGPVWPNDRLSAVVSKAVDGDDDGASASENRK